MPEERALIQFRCVSEKHQQPKAGVSDLLTVYERQWAYCPMDIRAKGHEWQATGGLSLNEVRMLVDRERNARKQAGS